MNQALRIMAVAAWAALGAAPVVAMAAADEQKLTVALADPQAPAMQPPVGVLSAPVAVAPPAATVDQPAPNTGTIDPAGADPIAALQAAAQRGDAKAAIELAVKYAHAEGVPRNQAKANQLFCGAAKYGNAEAMFQLGWVYANGRGVTRDEAAAGALFRRAADRGHEQAARLLAVMPERDDASLPACAAPAALPVAVLPKAPPEPVEAFPVAARSPGMPVMPPKEIAQLVHKLAPQYEVDANLVLAVIFAESAFNPNALSSANAQGLMQLIPETAERFGVKQPFKPDENIKGGLAYLRWLLAYFQGDVQLVLAAYNAGEGAVEKFKGIPPYNETRDYVKKIIGIYQRLTHPYNSRVVSPSPVISQLKQLRLM